MSAMIDSPIRYVNRHTNRHRAHSPGTLAETASDVGPEPGSGHHAQVTADPAGDAELAGAAGPVVGAGPEWTAEERWDDRVWDDQAWDEPPATVDVPAPAPAPTPVTRARPALGPRPAAQPCDGLSVPPRRTVALFPPIRAGGRHRLPAAVRRRPGPVAAGLMVAATTLAAGSLRLSEPPTTRSSAGTGHQCARLLPGEPCG